MAPCWSRGRRSRASSRAAPTSAASANRCAVADGSPRRAAGAIPRSTSTEKRSNLTHLSSTDSEARLARKGDGREAKLSFAGHLLMENRQGLAVDVLVTQASGTAEREAALTMVKPLRGQHPTRRLTLGGDKASDTEGFVTDLRDLNVTPHGAQNITERRGSRIDGRTITQPGYAISQRLRKRIEAIFGWLKAVAGGRKLRSRGVKRNQLWADMATAAFNLVRIGNLVAEAA